MRKSNIEALANKMLRELEDEIEKRIDEVKGRGLKMLKEVHQDLIKEARRIDAEIAKEARRRRETVLREIKRDLRMRKMRLMDELMEDVFDRSLKRIEELPRDEKYANILIALIKEGLNALEIKEGVIHVNEKDKEIANRVIQKLNEEGFNLRLSKESINTAGGVFITSLDETVAYNNTFEARLRALKPRLRKEIFKILFG